MKLHFSFTAFITVVVCFCIFNSCKQTKDITPSVEYAPYISAYTGGLINTSSTIRVKLVDEVSDEVRERLADEKLLTFSPSLKGSSHWVGNSVIEFVPENGTLVPGTVYNATFALGKIIDVPKKYKNFDFSFRVESTGFTVEMNPFTISLDGLASVEGSIEFNEGKRLSDVKKMISAKLENDDIAVNVDGQDNLRTFSFSVFGIKRTDKNRELVLTFDGEKIDIDGREVRSVLIPSKDKFKLFNSEIMFSPEYGMRLTFSDLVDENQSIKSMITLKGIPSYTAKVSGNIVTIYFEHPKKMTELEATIDRHFKSKSGETMQGDEVLKLHLEKFKPQVEIIGNGAILPNSESVILPFRAVALKAVDLKIIRIFENNILMYLQDNNLDGGDYQLRRSGRLIYRKTLRLDGDPTKDISVWENYAIDLSQLIRQQPGAIYRIELSFKQAYASYECEDEEASEDELADAVDLTSVTAGDNDIAEVDEKYWNQPDTYYSDSYDANIDWNLYNWAERENPCNPTYYMNNEKRAKTNVLASNIGIIAKGNGNNTFWIAVSNLLDTKPMQSVEVTAYNFQLQKIGSVLTDENGFAVLSLKSSPFVIVARSGKETGYLRVADGDELMLSRFDVGGVELQKGLKGFIYGERGVWRPGDTLHISFVVEDREGKLPANHPVSFELYNPRGQFYKKSVSTSGTNGFYTFHIPTKVDDQTGLWNAYVKLGGATFHKSLRIETVKPNRLKINLDMPKILDASKNTEKIGIHSQWLTGATAHNLDAKMELVLSKAVTQFKGYENYVFNNPATQFSTSTYEIFDGTLNDNGDVVFDMNIPKADNAPGMLRANITCRVFEPGGDASIYSESVPFSPYSSYVGIKFNTPKDQHYLFTDEDHVFDVVTLSPEGKPVSRNNLEFFIYKIGWSWWWESQNESFDSYINNSNITPLFTGKINTTNGKGQIKMRIDYPEWGRYLVFVKDPQSGHATGGTVLIDWPTWRGRSGKEDPDGVKMLTFTTDKESYEVGENITVNIPAAAADGRALVAIENGTEVIRHEWVPLAKGEDKKYTFKATETMSPNIYVHISLLLPHAATTDLPIRMYGVQPVFVSNKDSKLQPVITMDEVLRPETDFTVKIKEQNGKPMTYTLAIVDDGLLDLTNFKTPDPWNTFYAREALGIKTWDLYDEVMGAFAGKYGSLFSVGGDAELDVSKQKANRFKPVVLYVGPVSIGAREEKKHKLVLPPYVGSVRVMVVAGRDGAYGNAEKTVPVRSPLMILSSLPRVLSTDEEIELPVNVFVMEDGVKDVNVKVETTGKLKSVDGDTKSLKFSKPGDDMVYFRMKTGNISGVEKVTVIATGGGKTSKETIEIDIRNPNPPLVTFRNKLLEKGESIDFDYNLDEEYDENRVKIEASRIPTVDISRRFDFLYNYSHYCTEQLTSRALPLLFLSELKDLDGAEEKQIKTNITDAINSLYKRQVANGGFEYWQGDGYATDWVTSYAGNFLVLAKERGFSVNQSVINKWISYQRNVVNNWRKNGYVNNRYTYHQSDLEQAYRLYTLALAGVPEMGAMNRMKEIKELSQQAKWRLASAYALCGKTDAAKEIIFNVPATVSPYSLDNPTYGSSLRDEAMILETLVQLGKNEDAFKQAQNISKQLSEEDYFCTQSTAYAMVAMGQLAAKMSGKLNFEWSLNGKKQDKIDSRKAVYQKQLPTKPAAGKVSFQNGNEGSLYVSIVTKTCPIKDVSPEIAEKLKLDVSYTDLEGNAIDETDIEQGADFYAVVKVSNISGHQSYCDVALTHIIPSGWEIYNERMIAASTLEDGQDEAETSKLFRYQDIRDDRILTYFDLPSGKSKEFKIRLQASYIGDFVLPAIQCEAMYDPSARARTQAGRVRVEK